MEDGPPYRSSATFAQELSLWVAGAFIALACFGFLAGLTDRTGSWALDTEPLLFGVFHVSVLHNVVHLLLGTLALTAAGSERACRAFLVTTGAVLLLLVSYGQLGMGLPVIGLVPVSTADAWLHITLAVTMLVGAAPIRRRARDSHH